MKFFITILILSSHFILIECSKCSEFVFSCSALGGVCDEISGKCKCYSFYSGADCRECIYYLFYIKKKLKIDFFDGLNFLKDDELIILGKLL